MNMPCVRAVLRACALGAAALAKTLATLFVITAFSPTVHAEELPANAQTFHLDPDAREEFKDVIRRKERTGELAAFWKAYRDETIEAIKHPEPLGVRSDYTPRVEMRPVRFVVPADYRDERRNIVVLKGTVVEPLKALPLSTGLIFIDGRDPAQVDYAIARGRATPLKIVLTAGSPFDLRVKYQHAPWPTAQGVAGGAGQSFVSGAGQGIPFYFDQRGMIIDTLRRLYGIDVSRVPVVLTQSGIGARLEFGMRSAR